MTLIPAMHKPVPMESRVRFPDDFAKSTTYLTGTVVGVAFQHVFFSYIVLLDEPLDHPDGETMRAVCVPGGMLSSEDGSYDWNFERATA